VRIGIRGVRFRPWTFDSGTGRGIDWQNAWHGRKASCNERLDVPVPRHWTCERTAETQRGLRPPAGHGPRGEARQGVALKPPRGGPAHNPVPLPRPHGPFKDGSTVSQRRASLALTVCLALLLLRPAQAQPPLLGGRNVLGDDNQAPAVRHLDRPVGGWSVTETANFQLFHRQSRALAERAAVVAEQTRAATFRKWFGEAGPDWQPRCEVYLHATGADFSRETGVPAGVPGCSTARTEAGLVVLRRIDVHCDGPYLLAGWLPHEVTHMVMAGSFGEQPLPPWANEGLAVLAERPDRVQRHLRNLPRHDREGTLFPVCQLVELRDYPDAAHLGAFYAQSVSLVDFLTTEKGPRAFTDFLRDGARDGWETALRQSYGLTFKELDRRWRGFAFFNDLLGG
jgi:hypothetical protein